MNNISSIHHARFDKLHELTNNYNKAILLDKCIFWWQISTYTLKDNQIWFTRSIEEIAAEIKLSDRSVKRYLKEFSEMGLIVKVNKLFLKKHLYIRVTEKLLQILGSNTTSTPAITSTNTLNCNDIITSKDTFLEQVGTIEKDNLSLSIYKEKDNKHIVNNTVNQLFVDNSKQKTNIHTIYPTYRIEDSIGEQLTSREKNYIKGMMFNLEKQFGLELVRSEQLFAEIAFTVLNKEQLKGITSFNHRIQIISKLLRNKQWRTPKGFYNHAEWGRAFKQTIAKSDKDYIKNLNNSPITSKEGDSFQLQQYIKQIKSKIIEIDSDIHTQNSSIKFQLKYNAANSQATIHSVKNKISQLYTEKNLLNVELKTLLNKEIENTQSTVQNKIHCDFERYDALIEKQRTTASSIQKATKNLNEALSVSDYDCGENEYIQLCREEVQQLNQKSQLIDNELFELGELLFKCRVA